MKCSEAGQSVIKLGAVAGGVLAFCLADVRERGLAEELSLSVMAIDAGVADGTKERIRLPEPSEQAITPITQHSDLPPGDVVAPVFAEDIFEVGRCLAACMDHLFSWFMPEYVSKDAPRSFGLIYSSRQAYVAPILNLDATPGDNLAVPDYLSMRVSIAGSFAKHLDSDSTEVFYDQDATRNPNRLSFQFDANHLTTGLHNYLAEVRFWRGGTYTNQFHQSDLMVVRRDSSRYGAGWAPAGVQQLKVVDLNGSVMIWDADGSATLFRRACTSCALIPARGEFSRLTQSGDHYIRTYRDGTRVFFDVSLGLMRKVYDLYGDSTVLTWSGDTLQVIRDPAGLPIELLYTNGRLSSVRDSATSGAPRTYEFTYNSAGELTSIRNLQDSSATTFAYSASGSGSSGYRHLMSSITNARGKTTTLEYQHTRKLGNYVLPTTKLADGTSPVVKLGFASLETATVPAMASGQGLQLSPRQFWWSASLAHTLFAPSGDYKWITVDRYHAPTGLGFPTIARTEQWARDSLGQVLYYRNTRGTVSYLSYDSLGNLRTVYSSHTGRVDSITYATQDLGGVQVTVGPLDVRNNAGAPNLSYRYNGVALAESWIGPDASVKTRYVLRPDGRPDTIIDPAGHPTSFTYSDAGHKNLQEVRSGPDRTRFYYDEFGRIHRRHGANGDSMRYRYDKRNRLVASINAAGDSTAFQYDSLYLRKVTDPIGQTYQFAYNAIGLDTMHVDPGSRVDSMLYDKNGNLARWKNRRGQQITFAYDLLDRLITRTAGTDVTTFTQVYNDSTVVAANAASRDSIVFDIVGRLISETTIRNGTSYRLEHQYDVASRRIETRLAAPTFSPTPVVRWHFDSTGQVDSLVDASGYATLFGFNPDRLTDTIAFPTTGSATVASLWYPTTHHEGSIFYNKVVPDSIAGRYIRQDSLGRVVEAWFAPRDTLRLYQYDTRRRLWRTYFNADTAFSGSCSANNDFGFLCTGSEIVNYRFFEYVYDRVGNSSNSGESVQAGNRQTVIRSDYGELHTLSYDADGNLDSLRFTSTGGVLIGQRFFWNPLSQLDSVRTWNNEVVHNVGRYRYDAWGRRNWKFSLGDSLRFILDGDNIFAEIGSALDLAATYTFAPGSLSPHAMTRGGSTYYYLYDEAQNVTGLLKNDGTVPYRRRCPPWGAACENSGTVTNPFGFKGQYLDGESALTYMRARYYNASHRRFISEDPLRLAGGINTYVYADNDPINGSDPLGLQAERCRRVTAVGRFEGEIVYTQVTWDCPNPDPSGLNRAPQSSRGGLPISGQWGSGSAEWMQRASGATHPAAFDVAAGAFIAGISSIGRAVGGVVGASLWPAASAGPVTIRGITYSVHALQRMQPVGTIIRGTEMYSRGIPPSVVEHALRFGTQSPANFGRTAYTFENVRVIASQGGTYVWTVIKIGR